MGAYQSFAVTVTGGSHQKQGKGCQDASYHHDGGGISIAIVADGHGEDNCFRSDRGARFAVACAARGITDFAKTRGLDLSDAEKAMRVLIKHIIASWQESVLQDIAAHPFTQEELARADTKHRARYEAGLKPGKAYGTTLIAAVITKHYWFALHIGDGRLSALLPDGAFHQPVPWDEKCYLNVTTSLCDDDAFERARHYFSFHRENPPPAALFLCTDGIDDNYPVEENGQHLCKLYRTIALTFAEDGFESTCRQILDLAASFATNGKGDDTSIAGFIDMEALKQAAPLWRHMNEGV